MKLLSGKAKQILLFFFKIFIVVGAFYFIYSQLTKNENLNWDAFLLKFQKNKSVFGVFVILLLSFLNRYFEILKWQNLVASFEKISFYESSKQVLAALTVGLFTPNGIGEYAGKALYFKKTATKQILFLNLVCNGIQMIYSVGFGFLGLLILMILDKNEVYQKYFFACFAILIVLILLLIFSKKINIKGYSTQVLIDKLRELPKKIHQKNIFLGFLRYLTFTHQFYLLLIGFDVTVSYYIVIATIFVVYFLSSSLPTFQFLDFAVKGSVAVYFFNLLGVDAWIIVFITTLMWILNVVIPVIIGSYFVLRFKTDNL